MKCYFRSTETYYVVHVFYYISKLLKFQIFKIHSAPNILNKRSQICSQFRVTKINSNYFNTGDSSNKSMSKAWLSESPETSIIFNIIFSALHVCQEARSRQPFVTAWSISVLYLFLPGKTTTADLTPALLPEHAVCASHPTLPHSAVTPHTARLSRSSAPRREADTE